TQEAKDFKVVVTLSDPPEIVRPGLSTTARVTTATRENVVAVPLQALTIRRRSDIEAAERTARGEKTAEAAPVAKTEKDKEELQGVFVVKENKAEFVKVETGITGVTDIEVLSGLKENDDIVIGSYRVLRTLRNGAGVKKEKVSEKKADEGS
ncbi:MAG: efflux RND transporter periplasmic adaptor subunit, partial [Nevskiales bacterium]